MRRKTFITIAGLIAISVLVWVVTSRRSSPPVVAKSSIAFSKDTPDQESQSTIAAKVESIVSAYRETPRGSDPKRKTYSISPLDSKALAEISSGVQQAQLNYRSKQSVEFQDPRFGSSKKITSYSDKNEDGSRFSRVDTETLSANGTVLSAFSILKNQEGEWHLFQGNAIFLNMPKRASAVNEVADLMLSTFALPPEAPARLSGGAVAIDGKDYYLLVQRLSPEGLAYARNLFSASSKGKEGIDANDVMPAEIVQLIDKESSAVLSVHKYNEAGRLISAKDFQSVAYNQKLDPSLFKVPEGTRISVATSMAEYTNLVKSLINSTPKK